MFGATVKTVPRPISLLIPIFLNAGSFISFNDLCAMLVVVLYSLSGFFALILALYHYGLEQNLWDNTATSSSVSFTLSYCGQSNLGPR